MGNTLPNIEILFKQRASANIRRSNRGNAILILKDDTDKSFTTKEYKLLEELETDKQKYTVANYQAIKDMLQGGANTVTVIRIDTSKLVIDGLAIAKGLKSGRITCTNMSKGDADAIITWNKQVRDTDKKSFTSVISDSTTSPNHEGIVNLYKTKVTFKDDRGEQDSEAIIPYLAGVLAGCNVEKGSTYVEIPILKSVVEPTNVQTEISNGKMVLINDEGKVKIALGINSLTTFDENKTEDFSDILVVEVMDMIRDDARSTFKNDFVGKYKNNIDNQMIFIQAFNSYLKELEQQNILDKNYNNKSYINVEAQRNAWISAGKIEAKDWDESVVKNNAFKKSMFAAGDIKTLQSLNNLSFDIGMQ